MKRLLLILSLSLCATAQAEVWTARYGVAETFNFKLYNADGTLDVDEVDGGTEVSVSCNEGAETTATNDFADEGNFYSVALTATEMQCERIAVVIAATTTEVFFIQTIDSTSAMTPMIVQTGDSFARLGAPAGASVSADIAAIEGQTDDIGAAGAGLTSVPWNAAWDAEVESEATDALNAYDPPTRAELTTDINSVLTGLGIQTGTITLTSQTEFVLSAGSTNNDSYNNSLVYICDNGAPANCAKGVIEDYVGASKTVTLRSDPAIFTMGTGDTFVIMPAIIASVFNANVVQAEGADFSTFMDGHTNSAVTATTDLADDVAAKLGPILNCEVNTANFAGSTTTVACILTDGNGAPITVASNDLEGREFFVTSGTQVYEGRFITDSTWDGANSEVQLTLSRALPGTLADAVLAIIR